MFPLKVRTLIRGCQAHIRAGLGCGGDYSAYYVPLYASHTGGLYEPYWYKLGLGQGGKWVGIKRPNGDRIEFSHLSSYIRKSGSVVAGEKIAITGNTGTVTDFAHLHVQIFDKFGRRLDPETYAWDEPTGSMNIPKTFKRVWKRDGAPGEIKYFINRLLKGTIKPEELETKMKFWYGVVYPNGVYSLTGDLRWQREKTKVL